MYSIADRMGRKEKADERCGCNRFLFASAIRKCVGHLEVFIWLEERKRGRENAIRHGSKGKVESDKHKRRSELIEKPMKGVFDIHSVATGHCTTNAYNAVLRKTKPHAIFTLWYLAACTAQHMLLQKNTLSSKQGSTVETFDGAYYIFFSSFLFVIQKFSFHCRFWLRIGFRSHLNIFTCVVLLTAEATDDASIVNWFFVLEKRKKIIENLSRLYQYH